MLSFTILTTAASTATPSARPHAVMLDDAHLRAWLERGEVGLLSDIYARMSVLQVLPKVNSYRYNAEDCIALSQRQ